MDFNGTMPELPGWLVAVGVIVGLACVVLGVVALFKIFAKAGKPGWHAIIPILNLYDLYEICWGKGILFLLMLIPGVNVVVNIILYIKMARAFGQSTGFAIGLIFLPFIFQLILGFGTAQYIGPDGVRPAGAPLGNYPPAQ